MEDACTGLKALVLRRVKDTTAGTDTDTDTDPQIMEAAQRQLQLTDPESAPAGAYTANIAATGDRPIAALTIRGGVRTGDNCSLPCPLAVRPA